MAVGRQREASIDPFPAVCYEVDPKDLEGSHVPRISSQRSTSPPMRLFLPDSRCLPATEIYPFKWHVPTNSRSSRLESLACNFENSSRQTRVEKKKEKRKASLLRERESQFVGLYTQVWKIFLNCGFEAYLVLLHGMILLERPIYSIYRFWIVD